MNSNPVSELVAKLIASQVSLPDDKRARLASYYLRILSTNFADEFEASKNVELKLASEAGPNKDRVLRAYANFLNKRSIVNKQNVVKFLLKVAEDVQRPPDASNLLSNFSTRKTRLDTDLSASGPRFNDSAFHAKAANPSSLFNQTQLQSHSLVRSGDQGGVSGGPNPLYQRLFACLVSTFQGFQSEMFVFDSKVEMFVLRPAFEDKFPLAVVKLVYRLNEIGWLFSKIDESIAHLKGKIGGLTLQSLLSAVQAELTGFYSFLVSLTNIGRTLSLTSPHFLTTFLVTSEEQFRKLKTLACVLDYAHNFTSAEILSYLFVLSQRSFMRSEEYLTAVFRTTARSLMEFINNWVRKGDIIDPSGEFFIKANLAGADSDRYWKDGLVFLEAKIPTFIDATTAESIFTAGKIIQLIKKFASGYSQERPKDIELTEIVFNNNNFGVRNRLRGIYDAHNRILMDHLHGEQALADALRFLRDVYLTHRGDFCFQFVEELDKAVGLKSLPSIMKHTLLNCLDTAFKVGLEGRGRYAADLDVEFIERSINLATIAHEDVYEFFINFNVKTRPFPLPLNNVLSADVLRKYQLVFRYLLSLKIARFLLGKFWNLLSKHKNERKEQIYLLGRMCCGVLNKMTKFIDGLLSYWVFDVIERHWQPMFAQSTACRDFPQLIQVQEDFINRIVEELTFRSPGKPSELQAKQREAYNQALHAVLKLAHEFYDCQDTIFWKIKGNLASAEQSSFDSIERIENRDLERFMNFNEKQVRQMQTRIQKIDRQFCKAALPLIDLLRSKNTANKLDFNGWFAGYKENYE